MKRRSFLGMLAALPFIGTLVPKPIPELVSMSFISLDGYKTDKVHITCRLSDGTTCYTETLENDYVGRPPTIYYDSITHLPVKFKVPGYGSV